MVFVRLSRRRLGRGCKDSRLAEIAALLEKMQVQAELPEEDSTVFCIGIQLTSNTMISGLHFQVAQDSQLPETPWNLNQSQCQSI